jgi:hypothetical protein
MKRTCAAKSGAKEIEVGIPTNYIKKRDLLHSEKTSADTHLRIGREFLAQERYSDALDFFEKSKDIEAIKQIKKIALDHGDTFLLARLDRFDRNLLTREDWDQAARKAESLGRASMANFVARRFAPTAEPGAVAQKPEERPGEAPLSEV